MSNKATFINAVQDGDLKTVAAMLAKNPDLASAKNPLGEPALNLAVNNGKREIARALLEAGADANSDTPRLGLPLTNAACYWDKELVELLLDGGAEIDRLSMRGGESALLSACGSAKYDTVRLLLARGANLNLTDKDGSTALHMAIIRYPHRFDERERIVKLLIEHGIDVSVRNDAGRTPRQLCDYLRSQVEKQFRKDDDAYSAINAYWELSDILAVAERD